MASTPTTAGDQHILLAVVCFFLLLAAAPARSSIGGDSTPTPWPHRFHAVLFENYSGSLSTIDLWYDWPNRRNFNTIQHQLSPLLYEVKWNNGTSFYYTLENPECHVVHIGLRILRPDWLRGATYLGRRHVDGFVCDSWEKPGFVSYYEEVHTKRPVHWLFSTGRAIHALTFEEGAVLGEDAKWQAPLYCFQKITDDVKETESTSHSGADSFGLPETWMDIIRRDPLWFFHT